MADIYTGNFENWAGVMAAFEVKPALPEPEQVYGASYDIDGYEGSADVVYRHGDRVFWNHGSHCSCYGLEGQWDPEEYDIATALAAFRRVPNYALTDPLRNAIAGLAPLVNG